MIPDSLQLRRAAIAYVYPVAPPPDRSSNLAFYDEVTKTEDFPEMVQQVQELVLLDRRAPGYVHEVRVGAMPLAAPPAPGTNPGQPFRLLIAEQGSSRPIKFFSDSANTIFQAFQRYWGGRMGKLQLVEVSLIGVVAVRDPQGAVGVLKGKLLQTGKHEQNHLGRVFDSASLRLGSGPAINLGPQGSQPTGPLYGAHVALSIDPTMPDNQMLALTLQVKWPLMQLNLGELQMPPEARRELGGREFIEVNTVGRPPSEYVSQVYEYLEKNVVGFLGAAAR